MLQVADAHGFTSTRARCQLNIMDARHDSFERHVLRRLVTRGIAACPRHEAAGRSFHRRHEARRRARVLARTRCACRRASTESPGCDALSTLDAALDAARTSSRCQRRSGQALLARTAAAGTRRHVQSATRAGRHFRQHRAASRVARTVSRVKTRRGTGSRTPGLRRRGAIHATRLFVRRASESRQRTHTPPMLRIGRAPGWRTETGRGSRRRRMRESRRSPRAARRSRCVVFDEQRRCLADATSRDATRFTF